MSRHKIVFTDQARAPKFVIGFGLCTIIILAVVGVLVPLEYSWYRPYAYLLIVLMAALGAYALALGLQARNREYWIAQEYELTPSHLTRRHFGWGEESVELSNLESASERSDVIVLKDRAGGTVAFHRAISQLEEIEKRIAVPIQRRKASLAPVLVGGYLLLIVGLPLWFVHARSGSGALVWLGIIILPTTLSSGFAIYKAFRRNK